MKVCPRCKRRRRPTSFYQSNKYPRGLSPYCKDCSRARRKQYAPYTKEYNYRHYKQTHKYEILFRKYGVTEKQIKSCLKKQKNLCAICKEDFGEKWHVDHCHETGIFRGLLCGNCNRGIGQLKDSPERLRAAADYLDKFKDVVMESAPKQKTSKRKAPKSKAQRKRK